MWDIYQQILSNMFMNICSEMPIIHFLGFIWKFYGSTKSQLIPTDQTAPNRPVTLFGKYSQVFLADRTRAFRSISAATLSLQEILQTFWHGKSYLSTIHSAPQISTHNYPLFGTSLGSRHLSCLPVWAPSNLLAWQNAAIKRHFASSSSLWVQRPKLELALA